MKQDKTVVSSFVYMWPVYKLIIFVQYNGSILEIKK